MKIFHQILRFISIILVCFACRAIADSNPTPSTDYQPSGQQSTISEQTAVTIAQKQIDGRVLAIRLENNVYRIKILSKQSTVHIVAVSATNGKIMSSQ
jgi:uncharacterized membrane protein YkoI